MAMITIHTISLAAYRRGIKITHLRNHLQELVQLQAPIHFLIFFKQAQDFFEEHNITWQHYASTGPEPKLLPRFIKKSYEDWEVEEAGRDQESDSIISNVHRKEAGGSERRFHIEAYGLPKFHHLFELDGLPDRFDPFA